MRFKKIYIIFFSALIVLSGLGCGEIIGTEQAEEITYKVSNAVIAAFYQAYSNSRNKSDVTGYNSYTGSGWSAAMDYSYDDIDTYPVTVIVDFTWVSFTNGDVTLSDGTTNLEFYAKNEDYFTFNFSGNFNVMYDATDYAFEWRLSIEYDGSGSPVYDGSVYIENIEYIFE